MIAIMGQAVEMCRQEQEAAARRKPQLQVVRVNGKVRVIGVKEAAGWLGCSQTVVRDIAMGPARCARYSLALVGRIIREYPQLKGGA